VVKLQADKKLEKKNESKIFAGVTAPPTEQKLKEIILKYESENALHPLIKQYVYELHNRRYQNLN
jgi:hypothetical protein